MPTGHPELDNPSFSSSSQVILDWVKLTVKTKHHRDKLFQLLEENKNNYVCLADVGFGECLLVTSKLGEMENGEPILAVLRVYISLQQNHNLKPTNTILGYNFCICEI